MSDEDPRRGAEPGSRDRAERGLPRRRRAPTLIVLAVLAVAIALAAGRSHKHAILPSRPAPQGEAFGANTGRLFNSGTTSAAMIAEQLKALHGTGATLARSDALWEASEPQPPSGRIHHYNWAFDDTVASGLAVAGLTWLPVIDYSPPWARSIAGQDHSAPDPIEYAAYAAALAGRYGPGGSFWQTHPEFPARPVSTYEIWNEPDNPVFWVPKPDAAGYANLYLRARAAIDAVQPSAHVIIGGLTNPRGFLPALVAAAPALRSQLDGVGIHPYGATPQIVLAGVRTARATLNSLGLRGISLYVTEFGWTTRPPGARDYARERLRPGYIEDTLSGLAHTDCGIAAALLYAWVTPERNPRDAQDWFGIHPPAGGTSPDTAAFTQGLRAAATAGQTHPLCAGT